MDKQTALGHIKTALNIVVEGAGDGVDETTDLSDGVIDSLDQMTFLFELEQLIGSKIEEIDEEYTDYTIAALLKVLENY